MPGIDETREFTPIQLVVLTISDTRTEDDDRSGALLVERATTAGHRVLEKRIVPDDLEGLKRTFVELSERDDVDAIVTTGGTGLTGRDITPEAIEAVRDKDIPGFGELFRQISYGIIGTSTIQSRACAGVRRGTYVFCLPGSTSACRDGWDQILGFQLDSRYRPCNFVEIMPRLTEA
ncbi:MAG: molybdenum cofactor biosynthesis protein B [Myxococcota bacterium]